MAVDFQRAYRRDVRVEPSFGEGGALFLAVIVALALWPSLGAAQRLGGGKGFKLEMEGKSKLLLTAARATPLDEARRVLLTDAALQMYGENNNNPELRITAPECVFDTEAQTASSGGRLKVETPDGKFTIEGEGFSWLQNESMLYISNRVHTIVQPELLEGASSNGGGGRATEIFSGRFEYGKETGLGSYRDMVRMTGTNLNLTSDLLRFKLPVGQRQIEHLEAESNVTADYGDLHATGQSAVYSVTNGVIKMSGHPAWRSELREGRGAELIIDRTNRIFQANGDAWLRMPAPTTSGFGFLSFSGGATNAATGVTNRFIEVTCSSYEWRTNWAIFREPVRVTQLDDAQVNGTMNCQTMALTFAGTNQLQTLAADGQVVIQQTTNRFSGAKAFYTGTNGLLELSGDPVWQSGSRQGKGDLLQVETQRDRMRVRGNASLRLPAAEVSESAAITRPGGPPAPVQAHPASTNQFADIFCAEYTLGRDEALFDGGVHVVHPQIDLHCDSMTLESQPASGFDRRLIADRAVRFDLRNEQNQTVHGTGDKILYTYSVRGGATNDLLRLTGEAPILIATNNLGQSNVLRGSPISPIIIDRARNEITSEPGDWKMNGPATPINTNDLANPSKAKPDGVPPKAPPPRPHAFRPSPGSGAGSGLAPALWADLLPSPQLGLHLPNQEIAAKNARNVEERVILLCVLCALRGDFVFYPGDFSVTDERRTRRVTLSI